jgi:putative ABC transport system permease protein
LRIPLLAGRALQEGDESKWPVPTLLSQRAAQSLFGEDDPIGRRLFTRFYKEFSEMEVVGVVGEVRQRGIARESPLVVYMPTGLRFAPQYVLARLSPGMPVPVAAIREMISVKDPSLTAEIFTMDDRFDEETGEARFYFWLLGGFALSGLLIAVVGVYGVMAYSVSQRSREFAVRLALGARPGQVLWLSTRAALWMSAAGIALGLLGASTATRLLESLLYGVAPDDTATLVTVASLLAAAALGAATLAGRRATAIDPAAALKHD